MTGRIARRVEVFGRVQGVGFAITRIDEAEAERTLEVLRAMADAVENEPGEPLPARTPEPPGPPG